MPVKGLKAMIYPEPYTYLNYRTLFDKLRDYYVQGKRASFKLGGESWTIRRMSASGRLKKEKWMLIASDGTIRHYRRLTQALNYLRNLMGVEPEEEHIDVQIRKLINEVKDAQKKKSDT